MNTAAPTYEIIEKITKSGIQYFFISEGERNIIKVIQYTYVQQLLGFPIYNLGFGDYVLETDTLLDDSTVNNGDHYRVLHTVLKTIPEFFNTYTNALMMVQGSDSRQEFKETCRLNCRKKCQSGECKNSHRRINIYRNYLDKNYDRLIPYYIFLGGEISNDNQIVIETYKKGIKYDAILLQKNCMFVS